MQAAGANAQAFDALLAGAALRTRAAGTRAVRQASVGPERIAGHAALSFRAAREQRAWTADQAVATALRAGERVANADALGAPLANRARRVQSTLTVAKRRASVSQAGIARRASAARGTAHRKADRRAGRAGAASLTGQRVANAARGCTAKTGCAGPSRAAPASTLLTAVGAWATGPARRAAALHVGRGARGNARSPSSAIARAPANEANLAEGVGAANRLPGVAVVRKWWTPVQRVLGETEAFDAHRASDAVGVASTEHHRAHVATGAEAEAQPGACRAVAPCRQRAHDYQLPSIESAPGTARTAVLAARSACPELLKMNNTPVHTAVAPKA